MLYAKRRLAVVLVAIAFAPSAAFSVLSSRPATTAAFRHAPLLLSEQQPASVAAAPVEDCGCEDVGMVVPTNNVGVVMNDVRVTGATLRATELVDATGARATIGSMVGEEGKAVIVFLRHLGWPLCWNYAITWQREAERLSQAGVAGPLFISVGQPEQLAKFIEVQSPDLDGALALIDTSDDFAGYKAAGFNYLLGDKMLETPPDFKPPTDMGPRKWLSYMKNVVTLSPIPKDMKFGDTPQGVKVLGGTYAIDGDAVTFSHMDEVPGATPDVADVLKAVGA